MKFNGVCCGCQHTYPVRKMVGAPRLVEDGMDDEGYVFIDNNPFDYVMEEHFPFSDKPCAGTGDSPQALVKVKP